MASLKSQLNPTFINCLFSTQYLDIMRIMSIFLFHSIWNFNISKLEAADRFGGFRKCFFFFVCLVFCYFSIGVSGLLKRLCTRCIISFLCFETTFSVVTLCCRNSLFVSLFLSVLVSLYNKYHFVFAAVFFFCSLVLKKSHDGRQRKS